MKIKCGKRVFNIFNDKPWEIPTNTKNLLKTIDKQKFLIKLKTTMEKLYAKEKIL